MLLRLIVLAIGILMFTPGCASTPGAAAPPITASGTSSANSPDANKNTNVAACTTLSKEEILTVQGEIVRETKGNDSTSEGLRVSHCVYLLPTYSRSLSLDITRAAQENAGHDAIEKFWETRFAESESQEERERDRDLEKARGSEPKARGEREEEERESKPRPVAGVGEEAYWVGSGVKGALFVRKGDAVLILSIGGAEAESTRIKKTVELAQHALKRIP